VGNHAHHEVDAVDADGGGGRDQHRGGDGALGKGPLLGSSSAHADERDASPEVVGVLNSIH